MSVYVGAKDGSHFVRPLFAKNNTETMRFMLGAATVELNTKHHPNGSKTLDVLLRQNLDSNYTAEYPHPIGCSSESQETKLLLEEAKQKPQKTKWGFDNEMRGWMMILATIFASMTFQAGLNPPGGVWQDDAPSPVLRTMNNTNSSNNNVTTSFAQNDHENNESQGHTAGSFVLEQKNYARYETFCVCNSLAFVYSMGAIFLMMSETYIWEEGAAVYLRVLMIPDMILVVVAFAVGSTRHLRHTVAPLVAMFFFFVFPACWIVAKKMKGKRPIDNASTNVQT